MLQIISPWLAIALMFAGAFMIFTRVYRVALVWFIRGRASRLWEKRAELATLAASLPFALVYGLISIEVIAFAGRMVSNMGLPLFLIPQLNFSGAEKVWMVAAMSMLFLAWMVPQTIASSKLYAFGIDEK